jgi:hypothetical protein
MKIPHRISDIISRKQDFIDQHRDRLEKTVIKLQSDLLDKVIAEIVPQLDIKDGLITDSTHNYQLLGDMDKVYKDFTNMSSSLIANQMSGVTNGLVNLGKSYFTVALTDDLVKRFDKIVDATTKKMNIRIGLDGGQLVRGGYLESFLKDQTLGTQIKNYIAKSVTGQIDTKDFISGLTDLVKGVPHIDKNGDTIQTGALEKQFQRYGYDLYQQYDAAYNSTLAQEFDMNYFIYQGGLIKDSRDFCAAHNNNVYSKEEAAEWVNWVPSMGVYPPGYVVKQKDNSHPGYMDYPGYTPLVDRGGYNCRHMLGYISDELAFSLRPDLKETI